MIPIKFSGRKFKTGNVSSAVLIPKPIADLLDSEEEYLFTITKKDGDMNEEHKLLCAETEGEPDHR